MHIMNIFHDWAMRCKEIYKWTKIDHLALTQFLFTRLQLVANTQLWSKSAFPQGGTAARPTLFPIDRSQVSFPLRPARQLSVNYPRWAPIPARYNCKTLYKCRKWKCGAQKPLRMWHVSCCKHSLSWQSNHLDHGSCAQGQIKDICSLSCIFFSLPRHWMKFCTDLIFWPSWNNQQWRYFANCIADPICT